MDPRWLPWCWAAGAAGCVVVFLAVQPWRAEWAVGGRLMMKYPGAWLWLAGLWVLDAVFASFSGRAWLPQSLPAWSGVGQSIAVTLHGPGLEGGAALAGAVLLALNAGGIRRGFLKGVESVSGKSGAGVIWILLLGAVALVADVALRGYGVPGIWHGAVRAVAVPLVGWISATVLAGWLLLAETFIRAPEKVAEVRWLESSAAHSVRLWPWALGHGVVWWLADGVPGWAGSYARGMLALASVLPAFAPLVFLHVKRLGEARPGAAAALGLWRSDWWQFPAWLATAGLLFFLWDLAGKGLAGAVADEAGRWRIGLATLHGTVHIALTMLSLGAWVALRLAGEPPAKRPRGPRR